MSTTSSGSFWIFLRLRSMVTPDFRPIPAVDASAACPSLSKAVFMASFAKLTTWAAVRALDAERLPLTGALEPVGTGGTGGATMAVMFEEEPLVAMRRP